MAEHDPIGVVAAAEAGEPPACSCGKTIWCELEKRDNNPNEEPTAVPEGGGSVSFERVRLYLERHPEAFNLAGEIDYHDGYVGEDWPRRAYALPRKDIEDLLEDVEVATRELIEAKEAAENLLEQKRQWAKDAAEVEQLKALIQSMRMNGAQHHFAYGWQKYSEEQRRWIDHCKVCTKDYGHPAHFASGSKYLDSRVVEKQAVTAVKRVVEMLEGQGFRPLLAQNTARELLAGLPGIPEPFDGEEEPQGRCTKPRVCNVCSRDEDHHEGADHPFSWGSTPR
jgi:hypothetical protein